MDFSTIERTGPMAMEADPNPPIHFLSPKDLQVPYTDAAHKHQRVKDDGTNEQLKFAGNVLQELSQQQYWAVASPFYEPVDCVQLGISSPSYQKIIQTPMDLSTMKRKLDNRQYATAQKFHDDFKLMIRNCFMINSMGTPVNQAGVELQRLFDEMWKNLPPLHDVSDDESEEEEDDRARTIAIMEAQIETMRGSIASLKSIKKPKKEKKNVKPVAVLTFAQKKDLREAIASLDGPNLERVIQIIHDGMPEIQESTEEIGLEIDLLPATVLSKLYDFVIRPLRAPETKPNRTVKGTGMNRQSMDEDVEMEKIRQLEERMKGNQKPVAEDDILTFEQKKDLSEAITLLEGPKLQRVIQIIQDSVEEIKDSTDEIELEIDLLPAKVLSKLYNFVIRPLRAPATKPNRIVKGTGMNRQSMDEAVEAEKIRQLEERIKMFDPTGAGTSYPTPSPGGKVGRGDYSEHSSDSSSDESDSDSE